MATGTSLKAIPSQTTKLSSIEEEKVSSIVEICNVSRDEAVRVLDACHMDETMAIERFLNGTEVSTWSQVSKKKRPASQSRGGSGTRAGQGSSRSHDREKDPDGDRRDRDRSASHPSDYSNPQNGHRRGSRHHGHQRSKELLTGSYRKRGSQTERKSSPAHGAALPPEQPDLRSSPSNEESWGNPGTVNGVAGESWPDTHSSPTDPWNDNGAAGVHIDSPTGAWATPGQTSAVSSSGWPVQNTSDNADNSPDAIAEHDSSTSAPKPRPVEGSQSQPVPSLSTVKKTFNYAAAAAAGTSHEKPTSLTKDIPTQISIDTSNTPTPVTSDVPVPLDNVMPGEATDSKKRRSRGGRKQRRRVDGDTDSLEANVDARQAPEGGPELFDSHGESTASKSENLPDEGVSHTNAWGASPRSANDTNGSGQHITGNPATLVGTSTSVMGTDHAVGDSLSLQFGSFGLGGLDGVNWSASEQNSSDVAVNNIVSPKAATVQPAPTIPMQPSDAPGVRSASIAPGTSAVEMASAPLPTSARMDMSNNTAKPEDVSTHATASSSGPLPVHSSSSGSGVVPVLPVGPSGNFAHANYATPYLMPPLHNYSPAMTSYENGGDLGSSRTPSLAPPGSLPMYDPAALPGMPTGNGKYGGIPGLGDMSGLQGVQLPVSKDGQHGNAGELDKSNPVPTSALPAGMDPLAPPYVMPGYPSMQYPMYTFPTGPYAPPGMAPPGPSPFPYPPPGQVPSQGGRGGFGFEDASISLTGSSRGGSALSESMYTPGYLNTSMNHSSSQKGSNEGAFKAMRGNPGNGLAGASMGAGMVPGMPYSDYPSGIPVVSNGIGTAGSGPGSWNNSRQHHGGRAESGNGPGIASNQGMAGASPSSSIYTAGPGTQGGYWGPQQGSYYQ